MYYHYGKQLNWPLFRGCPLFRGFRGSTIRSSTVKPPNSGHHWDSEICPLKRGCPLSEVILYRVCILEYIGCVLCWEVCPLSECPFRCVYTRVHWVSPLLGGLSSFGVSLRSVYTRVHWVCHLLGGLSSFEVSLIGGFTVQYNYSKEVCRGRGLYIVYAMTMLMLMQFPTELRPYAWVSTTTTLERATMATVILSRSAMHQTQSYKECIHEVCMVCLYLHGSCSWQMRTLETHWTVSRHSSLNTRTLRSHLWLRRKSSRYK